MKRVVITHSEDGIFVGHAMGLGFWSLHESAGQDCVVAFDDEAQARAQVRSWSRRHKIKDYGFVEVETENATFATIPELTAAGLESMLGELTFTQANVPFYGNA